MPNPGVSMRHLQRRYGTTAMRSRQVSLSPLVHTIALLIFLPLSVLSTGGLLVLVVCCAGT